MKTIIINTIVDGVDAEHVNLWDVADGDNRKVINGFLLHGNIGAVVSEVGDYVEVSAMGRKHPGQTITILDTLEHVQGWCRKEFVKYAD